MSNRPNPLPPEVQEALQQGKLLQAVQLLRKSGLGLKEAREQLTAQAAPHPQPPRSAISGSTVTTHALPPHRIGDPSPGQVSKSADRLWGGVLLALAGLAGYYLLR